MSVDRRVSYRCGALFGDHTRGEGRCDFIDDDLMDPVGGINIEVIDATLEHRRLATADVPIDELCKGRVGFDRPTVKDPRRIGDVQINAAIDIRRNA